MKMFKKKSEKSSLLTEHVSDAFNFDTHMDFYSGNESNFKSIYSYQKMDSEADLDEKRENYKIVTVVFGILLVLFFPLFGWFSMKIITKDRKLAVFRYGKLKKIMNPGVAFIIPVIDSCKYIETEIKNISFEKSSFPTKDQGLIELDCTIKYRIKDPEYLIKNIADWTELIRNEARLCVGESVKNFRWVNFEASQINYDLELQALKELSTALCGKGIEICGVDISNIEQGKEPETPLDILKKINFKDLGRHFSSMTPLFVTPSMPNMGIPVASTEESKSENSVDKFFERLELIKNVALNNMHQQNTQTSSCVSSGNSNSNEVISEVMKSAIKDFLQNNISFVTFGKVLSRNSLECLFEEKDKVLDLSNLVKAIMIKHNITGNILFIVSKYLKEPCYFSFDKELGILVNGKIDNYSLMINIE